MCSSGEDTKSFSRQEMCYDAIVFSVFQNNEKMDQPPQITKTSHLSGTISLGSFKGVIWYLLKIIILCFGVTEYVDNALMFKKHIIFAPSLSNA